MFPIRVLFVWKLFLNYICIDTFPIHFTDRYGTVRQSLILGADTSSNKRSTVVYFFSRVE